MPAPAVHLAAARALTYSPPRAQRLAQRRGSSMMALRRWAVLALLSLLSGAGGAPVGADEVLPPPSLRACSARRTPRAYRRSAAATLAPMRAHPRSRTTLSTVCPGREARIFAPRAADRPAAAQIPRTRACHRRSQRRGWGCSLGSPTNLSWGGGCSSPHYLMGWARTPLLVTDGFRHRLPRITLNQGAGAALEWLERARAADPQ